MNIKSKKSLIIIIITALLGGISYFTFNPIETSHSFEQLKTLTEQGDAVDQYNLGVMYYNGESTPEIIMKRLNGLKNLLIKDLLKLNIN